MAYPVGIKCRKAAAVWDNMNISGKNKFLQMLAFAAVGELMHSEKFKYRKLSPKT
jgi:hypothetical protein